MSHEDAYSGRYDQPPEDQNQYGYYQNNGYYQGNDNRYGGRAYFPNQGWQAGPPPAQQPPQRGLFGLPLFGQPAPAPTVRNPNTIWGGRYN